jgi:chaperonin GroEL
MSKQTRTVVYGDRLQNSLAEGVEKLYHVAETAYGPKSGNVGIEMPYGDPTVSHDGVTNVEKVFLSNPIENMAVAILKQASKKSNKKVGDGTTGVVILAYYLYKEARKLVAGGYNRMEIAKMLRETATDAIEQIDKMKKPTDEQLLKYVAEISAGDQAIGNMIADVIQEIGIDGGVTIEDFAGVGIYNEIVDGFYFRKGFTNVNLTTDPTNLESKHDNVRIFITEKKLTTVTDVAPILEKIVKSGIKDLVIVGDVGEEALNVLFLNRLKGIITTTVVDAPVFDSMRSLFLEDLAVITDGTVFTPGANSSDFEVDMLGAAGKVIVNENSTTILDGDGDESGINSRVAELRDQLAQAESEVTIEALKNRLSRLTGKVAIIRVGGAVESEQAEVKLRVQDAICAVQAAIKDGIVPGGGVSLARIKPLHFQSAFKEPFKVLLANAGHDAPGDVLSEVLRKSLWFGIDLKSDSYEPVDLLKAGVIDPTWVMKEVIQNACSVVAQLITLKASIYHTEREAKID